MTQPQIESQTVKPVIKNRVILSASSVKSFLDCSYLFYQTRFNKVPDWTWPATKLGTLAHLILELLSNPRHKKHHDLITTSRTVYSSAAMTRVIRKFCAQNPDLDDTTLADLDKVLFTALDHDFFFEEATEVLPAEYAFEIDYHDFQIKGFIDRMAFYPGRARIRDYKTSKKKFDDEEMLWNIQSIFYQLAIRHNFNIPALVEFLFLRHPPTSRNATKHVQEVSPFPDEVLDGFIEYLREINRAINAMTEKSSEDNMKSTKDPGFCNFVCSLQKPFDYWQVTDAKGKVRSARLSKHLSKVEGITDEEIMSDVLRQLKMQPGETMVAKRWGGCPSFYNRATERVRNFQ